MSRGRAQVGRRPVLRHQMRRMLKAGRKKSRESDFYHRSDELSEGVGQSCVDSEPSLYFFSNGKPHDIPILYMRIIAQALKPTNTASTRILNFCVEWRNDKTIPQYGIYAIIPGWPNPLPTERRQTRITVIFGLMSTLKLSLRASSSSTLLMLFCHLASVIHRSR